MNVPLSDTKQRQQALDITSSFIVQAPAGSGKTELLVQRAIKCLLTCDEPNQVLILTFTKKAAIEINERIYDYIFNTEKRQSRQPQTNQLLIQLDRYIEKKRWDVSDNNLFNISKTFDAFTYGIADLKISLITHRDLLFEQIIDDIFFGSDYELVKSNLHAVLNHINWDYNQLKQLLVNLIGMRDQWLPPLLDQRYPSDQVYTIFTDALIKQLLQQIDRDCEHLITLVAPYINSSNHNYHTWTLQDWQAFIQLTLTKTGIWRKKINLPDIDKEQKKILNQSLLCQEKSLAKKLFRLEGLPKTLPIANIRIIQDLQQFLPQLCALIDMHMIQKKQCDFTFLTLKAIELLNSEQLVTQHQYAMQIKHMLIDECQDTSQLQAILIESIVKLWSGDTNHSLFIVGDPMQSIYKFRQADVRLFKQIQQKGIAHIPLTSIALTTNFRSSDCLINHFNDVYHHIFPKNDDLILGGIPYHASTAYHQRSGAVMWWDIDEIEPIIDFIKHVKQTETVAVLARSRSHLLAIYAAMNMAVNTPGLFFLYEYPWIQEMSAILIDIFAPDDISALALQRLSSIQKPWSDIFNKNRLTIESDLQTAILDARKQTAFKYPSQILIPIVKILMPNHYHHEISQFFYQQIDLLQDEHIIINRHSVQHVLNQQRADIRTNSSHIYLMTIHQSKGLEFDHVIIPKIHARTMVDSDQLIHWFQYDANKPMMIGNIQNEAKNDTVNKTLRKLNQQSNDYEASRLLYVAATRARQTLIYVGLEEKNSGFTSLLKKSDFSSTPLPVYESNHPIKTHVKAQRPFTTKPHGLNDLIHQQDEKQFLDIPKLIDDRSQFGVAIHHLIEIFLSLNITMDKAITNKTIVKISSHYDQRFETNQFSHLFKNMSQSETARWLFEDYEKRFCELTLYDKNQSIIRIDYYVKKNNRHYIVDFKTNTKNIQSYSAQLTSYADALANYLQTPIDECLIFNPLTNQIFYLNGKQFHLETILC